MRRLSILLGLPAALSLILVAFAPVPASADPECGPNMTLASQADSVETNVATEWGTADYVYHTRTLYARDTGQVIPVHAGGQHGLESAYTPTNTDGHLYYADMSILHWISGGDCSGPDDYAYDAWVGCADSPDHIISDFEQIPCYYDAWISLQRVAGSFSDSYSNPWGISHRSNAVARKRCHAKGGPHSIADDYGWVRTWLYLDGEFASPYRLFNARKSTSKEMYTSSAHVYDNGPCWPDWCDATTPPNNDAATKFTECSAT